MVEPTSVQIRRRSAGGWFWAVWYSEGHVSHLLDRSGDAPSLEAALEAIKGVLVQHEIDHGEPGPGEAAFNAAFGSLPGLTLDY